MNYSVDNNSESVSNTIVSVQNKEERNEENGNFELKGQNVVKSSAFKKLFQRSNSIKKVMNLQRK